MGDFPRVHKEMNQFDDRIAALNAALQTEVIDKMLKEIPNM